MSSLDALGLRARSSTDRGRSGPATAIILVHRPLDRILAFRGRTIDDVVNNPIVKNEIFHYFKAHKQIQRTVARIELERQWNPHRP